MRCLFIRRLILLCLVALPVLSQPEEVINSEKLRFRVEVLEQGLDHPWGMAFLPGGDILVTERPGRLWRIDPTVPTRTEIDGLPEVNEKKQGGLMGLALHPGFTNNRWVYLAHAVKGRGGYGSEVTRGRLRGNRLESIEPVFAALPKSGGGRHFGSRLVFAPDGTLFISLGDRGERPSAQDLDDHRGSLIRLHDDGQVPADNPFVGKPDFRPEIYSYGHRNIQGMTLHPDTGTLWLHEHGPQGGDEINIIKKGGNYGWPVITYGANYVSGTPIGEGTHKPGMVQPYHYWVPSIAPSGMAFYSGGAFALWQGNLLVGSLKFGLLVRLELGEGRIVHEERLLDNRFGRIRDVVQGPDGLVYLLTDASDGKLLRLLPEDS